MRMIQLICIALLIPCLGISQLIDKIITKAETERIEGILASDAMEGRKTFSPGIDKAAAFICFKGETSNTLYKNDSENIHILLKKGGISTISEVQNALIVESLSTPVKKFYICSLNE